MNKKTILLTLIILFFGIGLFYWFQIRPGNIKQRCDAQANQGLKDNNFGVNPGISDPDNAREYNDFFQKCLHEKGL